MEPGGGEGLYPENKKMKKVYIRRTRKEKGLYRENNEGRRFISGEKERKKVYIQRTMKDKGLYPEKKKGKRFISGEQWRKKVYIRRKRKEKGLCPENNEGRKSISEEKKNTGSNSKVLGALQNSESNSQTLRVSTPPSENKKGRRSWENF